jgi:hypothetical protein
MYSWGDALIFAGEFVRKKYPRIASKKVNPEQAEISPIDGSLVMHLLTLSYEERLEAHECARELMRDLSLAGKEFYAGQFKRAP